MKVILLIFFMFFVSFSFTQIEKHKKTQINANKLPYFLKTDSTTACSLVSFKYQYYYQIPNGFFRNGGTHIDVGINIARFFTSKFILGIGFDYKILPYLGKQSLSKELVNDFNDSYTPVQNDFYDLIRSETLFGVVNSIPDYKIMSSRFFHFSLNFSPFPDRYGGIMIQVKYGSSGIRITGPKIGEYEKSDKPTLAIGTGRKIGLELSFNPYKIAYSHRKKIINRYPKGWYKFIVISFYYEKNSLKNATLGGESLSKFVSQNFIDKYSNVNSFGIKAGIGIW